jgi:hypothetical protein
VPQLPAVVLVHKNEAVANFPIAKVSTSASPEDSLFRPWLITAFEIAKAYWTANWQR